MLIITIYSQLSLNRTQDIVQITESTGLLKQFVYMNFDICPHFGINICTD